MKKIIKYSVITFLFLIIVAFGINQYVIISTKKQIITEKFCVKVQDVDCILVLGAGADGNKPSLMLKDRLETGISLFNSEISNRIIMSGDHGRKEYDEVNTMKDYAISKGVPSESIFMDHAGFSTYESIYRAKEIFKAEKIIIVSQDYHLYRALYIANKLGIEAYGVSAKNVQYKGALFREIREILARNKDFFKCFFKPKPTFLGETIPVSGNGNITNDNNKTQ